jgi:hypothetical protein
MVHASALGTPQQLASARVDQTDSLVERARAGCAAGKAGRARRGLAGAARKLAKLERLLRSRKARSAPQELRDALIAEAEVIRTNVLAVRSGLHCP